MIRVRSSILALFLSVCACTWATPPLPSLVIETNSPAGSSAEDVDTGEGTTSIDGPPAFVPPPPKISTFSKWQDGAITDMDADGFAILAIEHTYSVEWTPDIARVDWIVLKTFDNPAGVTRFVRENEGFYRVKKHRKPYPPYGLGNFGHAETTNKTAGRFVRKE